MKIGIDLDNTILESKLFELTFKHFGKKEMVPEDWEMSNFPKDVREEIYKRFDSPYWMCHKDVVKPIKGSVKTLNGWKCNNELILITARSKDIRLDTRKMVNRFFPMIDKVLFVNRGERKINVFKRIGIDVWIDDNHFDCSISAQMGIKTYLISNRKTKYNRVLLERKDIEIVKNIVEINLLT